MMHPDIIISWDISEKDNPIINITKIEYDPKVKHVIGTVIESIDAGTGGAVSINQIIAAYELSKARQAAQEGEQMTALEKQIKIKELLHVMCGGTGCEDCILFKPEDDTDGEFFCAIRDKDKNIPADLQWDMGSAMISD